MGVRFVHLIVQRIMGRFVGEFDASLIGGFSDGGHVCGFSSFLTENRGSSELTAKSTVDSLTGLARDWMGD